PLSSELPAVPFAGPLPELACGPPPGRVDGRGPVPAAWTAPELAASLDPVMRSIRRSFRMDYSGSPNRSIHDSQIEQEATVVPPRRTIPGTPAQSTER